MYSSPQAQNVMTIIITGISIITGLSSSSEVSSFTGYFFLFFTTVKKLLLYAPQIARHRSGNLT